MANLAEEICIAFSRGRPMLRATENWWPTRWEDVELDLSRMVYGSNRIDSAGNSLAITLRLCQAAFRDQVTSAGIGRTDPTFKEHWRYLRASRRSVSLNNICQSRREILQHAYALSYMIDHVVLDRKPWSEDLILETHRILGHCLDDSVEQGRYRTHKVVAECEKPDSQPMSNPLTSPELIPGYVADMVQHLNRDTTKADAGDLDPYTLAARYHNQFVSIRPFGDGNGRMARILLNCLLLRHAGHISDIGVEAEERDQYVGITRPPVPVFAFDDQKVEVKTEAWDNQLEELLLNKERLSPARPHVER
ncbi:fido domain-containing protein [Thermothelomyces heterothallicus CBS 202.75]|uniref:fido domain-containing protein n=1 Tax=Thermothelomyces heterothallicus CBS 202.75 TaxID=1149848 RepID=UPI0037437BCD